MAYMFGTQGRMTRDTPLSFRLQFPQSDIGRLSAAYSLCDKEYAALAAGMRIRAGEYSRSNLAPIFTWKVSDRGRSRPLRNSDEEVADALQTSLMASTPRAAVAVLIGLSGVAVPVASAILATIKPEQYSVLDTRSLQALGCGPAEIGARQSIPIEMYLRYLSYCRCLAADCQVRLQDFDRACRQWATTHAGCHRKKGLFPDIAYQGSTDFKNSF